MKLFRPRTQPITTPEFESQQQKLARLSGDILRRYRADLDTEINDPARLKAVYGSRFATADGVEQAEVVAVMASQMLSVPNVMVNIVLPDRQATVARVAGGKIQRPEDSARKDSFCQHVIGTGREFSVADATRHPLVCDTKWATDGEIVSYLGVPIANTDAIIVGVLCVFDAVERFWSAADVSMLTQLSLVLTRSTVAE